MHSSVICYFRSLVFYAGYILFVLGLGIFAFVLKLLRTAPETNYYLLIRFSGLMIYWARLACGIKYRVIGQENIPDEPCVIVSNHQSVWETYFFNLLFDPVSAVLKAELLRIPFFGIALDMVQPIAIDRAQPAMALKQLIKKGTARLKSGCWVLIFPEGTRVEKGQKQEFSAGGVMLAMKSESHILPVAHNAGEFWPAGRFKKKPGEVTIVIGASISTENKNRKELVAETESWIRSNVSLL